MKNIKPFLSNLIAHRGVHNKIIKENTITSIKKSIKLNVPVEFDITLTKDNVVVLCHDSYIKIINKKYEIRKYDFKYLKKICHNLVTLEEVLKVVCGKIPLLIEFKYYNKGNKLAKQACKLLDNYKGPFAIQSFSVKIVSWFKRNRKEYLVGQLCLRKYDSKVKRYIISKAVMLSMHFTNPDFLSYNIKDLPNEKIERLRKRMPVLGWTVKNVNQIEKNSDYCDNFICDNIEEIMEEL